jgi:PAS domain S-box-containing protein
VPGPGLTAVDLEPDPRNVAAARTVVRTALSSAGLDDLTEAAVLAVSEVVTNAVVHAGTGLSLRVLIGDDLVRVEVEDRGRAAPHRRSFAAAAGTGRGLQLVEDLTDRWGTAQLDDGKVVWFELLHPEHRGSQPRDRPHEPAGGDRVVAPDPTHVRVVLQRVPLLMHLAWQEHDAALLREYLLFTLGEDDDALDEHARASEAMSLLDAHIPLPPLSDEPERLMAAAVEPQVTGDDVVLEIPREAVESFRVLDELLGRAVEHARDGDLLCPPTQPEIREMRRWMCAEVARQSAGPATPRPWTMRVDPRATVGDRAGLAGSYALLAATDDAVVVTDEFSVVVAVSEAALEVLGFARDEQLLGRRVVVLIPARFQEAHVAGITLNATNGRDVLLGRAVRVPMVRADGAEVVVDLTVRAGSTPDGLHVFVASIVPLEGPGQSGS